MEKVTYQFDDFMMDVNPEYKDDIYAIHNAILQDGYKVKVESKANGFLVSYAHPKTKRSLLNFLFRKKMLVVRLYTEHINARNEIIKRFPESMQQAVIKAPVCKRLIKPDDCNPKCAMGYDFMMSDVHYQKCRYNCFMFFVTHESLPFINEFINNERSDRAVG